MSLFKFDSEKSQEENIEEFIAFLKEGNPTFGEFIANNLEYLTKLPSIDSTAAKTQARKKICKDVLYIIENDGKEVG